MITGGSDDRYNGRYERLSVECNEKPVYQLNRWNDNIILYSKHTYNRRESNQWYVGQLRHGTCDTRLNFITSTGNGGVCSLSPDGSGCVGRWQEYGTHGDYNGDPEWFFVEQRRPLLNAPLLTVRSGCPADHPCCGCGDHGSPIQAEDSDGGISCSCRCAGGFAGEFCQWPPAYVISGAYSGDVSSSASLQASLNGLYERVDTECNGKPVYELGGSDGWALFQPDDGGGDVNLPLVGSLGGLPNEWWGVGSARQVRQNCTVTPCLSPTSWHYPSDCYYGFEYMMIVSTPSYTFSCGMPQDCRYDVGPNSQMTIEATLAPGDHSNRPPVCVDSCRDFARNGICEEHSLPDAACHVNKTCECDEWTDGSDCVALRPCQ